MISTVLQRKVLLPQGGRISAVQGRAVDGQLHQPLHLVCLLPDRRCILTRGCRSPRQDCGGSLRSRQDGRAGPGEPVEQAHHLQRLEKLLLGLHSHR